MTAELDMAAGELGPGYHTPDQEPTRGSRSVARQAVVDTLTSRGARFGLAWIALLVLASVFAPFIACSFPLLVKENGHWSSPAMKQLTPADVTWLIGFLTAVALWISRKVRFGTAFATVTWIIALTIPLTLWPGIRYGILMRSGDALERSQRAVLRLEWVVLALAALIDLGFLVGLPLITRASRRYKLLIGFLSLIPIVLLICFPVRPPEANIYEEYRQKQTAGKLEAV